MGGDEGVPQPWLRVPDERLEPVPVTVRIVPLLRRLLGARFAPQRTTVPGRA